MPKKPYAYIAFSGPHLRPVIVGPPGPSNPCFFGFPCCYFSSLFAVFLDFFCAFFVSFSRILGVLRRETTLAFPCPPPPKNTKARVGGSGQSSAFCYFHRITKGPNRHRKPELSEQFFISEIILQTNFSSWRYEFQCEFCVNFRMNIPGRFKASWKGSNGDEKFMRKSTPARIHSQIHMDYLGKIHSFLLPSRSSESFSSN